MDKSEKWRPFPRVRIANRHPFDAKANYGLRCTRDCQWILVRSGELIYQYGRHEALRVPAGHMLFIPGGESHRLRAEKEGRLAGFHGEWVEVGEWCSGDYELPVAWRRVTHMPDSEGVVSLMTRMADLWAGFDVSRDYRLRCLAAEVLLSLASEWTGAASRVGTRRTEAMLIWIRAQMPRPVTRNDIAAAFGVTPSYVNQVFKRELNQTPGAVVTRERCALAHQALQDGANVSEAAYAVGYEDPFHFSRVFKRVYGVSPKHVRF